MQVAIDVVTFRRRRDAFRLYRRRRRLFDALERRPSFVRVFMTGRGGELYGPWKPHDVRFRASGRRRDGWGPPDVRRLAVISVWDDRGALEAAAESDLFAGALQRWHGRFDPLHSHGTIAGADPLAGAPHQPVAGRPGAIITYGRGRRRVLLRFVRKNNRVVEELHRRPELITAFNMADGLKPYLLTLSLWSDLGAAVDFGYRGGEHHDAIRRLREEHWATELWFARLGFVEGGGTLAGRDPFAGVLTPAA